MGLKLALFLPTNEMSLGCLGKLSEMIFRLNPINLIYGEFMDVSWR
jgi:hypothetical protein